METNRMDNVELEVLAYKSLDEDLHASTGQSVWFFLDIVVRVCACGSLVSCLRDVMPYEDEELMIRTMILLGELIVFFCVASVFKTVACDELVK